MATYKNLLREPLKEKGDILVHSVVFLCYVQLRSKLWNLISSYNLLFGKFMLFISMQLKKHMYMLYYKIYINFDKCKWFLDSLLVCLVKIKGQKKPCIGNDKNIYIHL